MCLSAGECVCYCLRLPGYTNTTGDRELQLSLSVIDFISHGCVCVSVSVREKFQKCVCPDPLSLSSIFTLWLRVQTLTCAWASAHKAISTSSSRSHFFSSCWDDEFYKGWRLSETHTHTFKCTWTWKDVKHVVSCQINGHSFFPPSSTCELCHPLCVPPVCCWLHAWVCSPPSYSPFVCFHDAQWLPGCVFVYEGTLHLALAQDCVSHLDLKLNLVVNGSSGLLLTADPLSGTNKLSDETKYEHVHNCGKTTLTLFLCEGTRLSRQMAPPT